MKKLRRVLSLLLVAVAFGSVSACTDTITGFDAEECDGDAPGSNNLCD